MQILTGLIIFIAGISGMIFVFAMGQESGYSKAMRELANKNMTNLKNEAYEHPTQNHKQHEPEETRKHRG